MSSNLGTIRTFGSLVRFSHTVFGLPFCLAAGAFAHRFAVAAGGAGIDLNKLLLVAVAFTGARTAAMAFNRIVDRRIDAENPRTAQRELPRGALSVGAAWGLTLAATAVFVAAAALLGKLPLMLSPVCVVVLFAYSYFKRFSWASHVVLGAALALAPAGAWVAVSGTLDGFATPALLMVAVTTWVAGFDVIYSLQDESFDRERGLHSIPVRFGRAGALWISGGLHVLTAAALVALHFFASLGWGHAVGVLCVIGLLAYEHSIVKPNDLSRVDKAFFDLNGYVSVVYLAGAVFDVFGPALSTPW